MAETAEVVATPVAPVEDAVPANGEEALKIVIKKALEVNGVIRGLSEVARALDRRTAALCILADDCEDPSYKTLIQALCKQNHIDIITIGERVKLAEWAGLAKYDKAGNLKKTFKCSSIVIKDFGEQSKALEMLMEQLK